MSQPSASESVQYLSFTISDGEYGIELVRVREIVAFQLPARVPTAPRFIAGLISVRGTTVPVINLAAKFGLPEAPVSDRTCIALIELTNHGQELLLGVIADAVTNIIELTPALIEPPPTFGSRIRLDFVLGVGKPEGALVFLLDIDQVLSPDELSASAELATEASESGA